MISPTLTRVIQIAIIGMVLFAAAKAQVASPHNFPHANSGVGLIYLPTTLYPSLPSLNMGMDGHVVFELYDKIQCYLFDSLMASQKQWSQTIGNSLAINKDRRIWHAKNEIPNTKIASFSRNGLIYGERLLSGINVYSMVADTSGHVYAVFNRSGFSGFGVMRFTTSLAPDYVKWYSHSTTSSGTAFWGIDQRLYISLNYELMVLGADGNLIKHILNVPPGITTYQDHGIGLAYFVNNWIHVERWDSSLNLMWSRQFQPGTSWNQQVYYGERVFGIAMPGSDDMVVIESTRNNQPIICSGSVESYHTRTCLFDKAGNMAGASPFTLNESRVASATVSPFGDAMVLIQSPSCNMGVTEWNYGISVVCGYDLRSSCSGNIPGFSVINATPSFTPVLGPTIAPSNLPLTPIASNLSQTMYSYTYPSNGYACQKPCGQVTVTQLGNGLVAFEDDIYGFYNLQYDFGDGTFGTTSDPVHQYAGVGPYPFLLTATNACGTDTIASILIQPCFQVQMVVPSPACLGSQVTFQEGTGLPGANLTWLVNGVVAGTGTTFTLASTSQTAFQIDLVFQNGSCTDTATANYSFWAPLTYSLGADTTFCPDTTWQLTAPPGATSYLWSTGAVTQSILVPAADTISVAVTDTHSCISRDTIALTVSPDCVWPGDANHDGVADIQDVLAVGYAFGTTEFARPAASPQWYGQLAPDWSLSLPGSVNYKHADCNGDGTVDYADTVSIATHYGQTHSKTGAITSEVPLWIEPEQDSFPVGDTVFFRIRWGDVNAPLSWAHGLAFTLAIDSQHVSPGSLQLHFLPSFLGTGVPDLLTFTHPDPNGSAWDLALTRKDRVGRYGRGALIRVGFVPQHVIPLSSTLGYVPVNLVNPFAVSSQYLPILTSASGDSILVFDAIITQSQDNPLQRCQLYPVPTADAAVLAIDLTAAAIVEATLTDLQGRHLASLLPAQTLDSGRSRITIPTDGLSNGMYFVQLTVNGTVATRKLVVAR